LYLLAIIVLTLAAYSGTIRNGFIHFDDTVYITENPHVKEGLSLSGVTWSFHAFHAGNWHPLTWLSHMADVSLFGLDPSGHHAMGLLIHVLAALLLFALLRQVTGSLHGAALVAALFAIHPLHVESVAWASERKDVLSAFFWFATLWAYARYVKKNAAVWYGMVLLLFACGLMAKPMLVTLPVLLLLFDFWPLGRFGKENVPAFRLIMEKLPLFGLVAGSVVLTLIAQREAIAPLDKVSLVERLTNAVVSYGVYLLQTVLPAGLAVFYPFPEKPQVVLAVVLLGGFCLLTFVAIRQWKRRPYLLFGWLWYCITLVPVIGILQVGAQAHADRYTYIPLVGIFIMIVWFLRDTAIRQNKAQRRLMATVAVVIIAGMVVLTARQVRVWNNDEALFSHALKVTRNNYVALNNLGLLYDNNGRADKALEYFTAAIRIKPDFAEALNNIGNLMRGEGNGDEAMQYYRRALAANPDLAVVHSNLGIELAKRGNTAEAAEQYRKAISLEPQRADAYYNYGNLLAAAGRYEEALTYFKKACERAPDSCEIHNNLGLMLARTGKGDEAITEYHKAITLRPDYAEAYNNLGILHTITGRTPEAIAAYEKSLALDSNNVSAYNNLAFVFQNSGNSEKAVDLLRKARRLAPDNYRIVMSLADAAAVAGDTTEAVRLLNDALPMARAAGDTVQAVAIGAKLSAWSTGYHVQSSRKKPKKPIVE
jgi:tetratricopeptide (TPR) repeat protein